MRRACLVACTLFLARAATAQTQDADAAFARGDFAAARAAYEQVLARDSLSVRALYRLAILDSWDGALDRSLERLRRLRRLEPLDPDFAVAHARVLSWAGKYAAAASVYDSVLAASPHRADALAGLARTTAWKGDLPRAEALWRGALAAHPDDPEINVGLAQTLLWRGQAALAEGYATRARQLAPEDRSARDVLDLIEAALAPEFSTTADYNHDSDDNDILTHRLSYSVSLAGGRRAAAYGLWRRATDPARSGGSYTLGGRLTTPLGQTVLARAALGGQLLAPDSAGPYTTLAPELALSARLSRTAAVTLGWRRGYFDETAILLRRHLTTNALDLDVELAPVPRVTVLLAAGSLWLTDNTRWSALGAVMVAAAPGLELGGLARAFAYDTNPGMGYFAPDLFALLEARARYERRFGHWGVQGDGGFGSQQVGRGSARQTAWRARLGVSRRWSAANELSLTAGWSNSAASSATGAYHSWSTALQWRQGF